VALPPLPGRTTGCVTVPSFNAGNQIGVKMPVICYEQKRLSNVSKLLHCVVQKENCSIATCSALPISLLKQRPRLFLMGFFILVLFSLLACHVSFSDDVI
jgi:hypothetical protein